MIEKVIRSEEDCRRFGLCLAERLKPGDVVALIGDLGVGKTTLTKYIAQGLGISEMITSPTFTVVCEYRSGVRAGCHSTIWTCTAWKTPETYLKAA